MDEAASRLRMQVDCKPEELDELDRRIIQLKIEREALKKETDQASRDRLERLEKELAELEEKSAELTAQWQAEKDKLADSQKIKEQLDKARSELEIAQRKGDLGRGGRAGLRRDPRPREEAQGGREPRGPGGKGVKEEVTPEDIAAVVSRWTGMPVDKMLEGERDKLLRMEEQLAQARGRPGRGGARRRQRGAPRPRRPAGPEPADRLVPVPGPDRRRQDRADQGARRIPVRRRPGDGAHRHERVHGEALRQPPDRRAAGLCRLRRGRRADRGGAAAALPGDPVRRGREGASGRVQRAAAGAGRRPPDRRPGPHGRFQEHADRADLEPRQRASGGAARTASRPRRCASR